MRDKLNRLWRVYYDSYGFHVAVFSIAARLVLPAVTSTETASGISQQLHALSIALTTTHLPRFMAGLDFDIPHWYSVVVNGYLAVLAVIYISGLDSQIAFVFDTFPIVIIPIVALAIYVVFRDDEFDIEEDWD